MKDVTLEEEIARIEQEIATILSARISPEELITPLRHFAEIAYYTATPLSEQSGPNREAYGNGAEVTQLKQAQVSAYSAQLAIDVITTDQGFRDRYDIGKFNPLSRNIFRDAYQAYTDGRFGDALTLLTRPLFYISGSIFNAEQNIHAGNADLKIVQRQALMLMEAIIKTRDVFYVVIKKAEEDIAANGEKRRGEYVMPSDLAPISKNLAEYFRNYKPETS